MQMIKLEWSNKSPLTINAIEMNIKQQRLRALCKRFFLATKFTFDTIRRVLRWFRSPGKNHPSKWLEVYDRTENASEWKMWTAWSVLCFERNQSKCKMCKPKYFTVLFESSSHRVAAYTHSLHFQVNVVDPIHTLCTALSTLKAQILSWCSFCFAMCCMLCDPIPMPGSLNSKLNESSSSSTPAQRKATTERNQQCD